MLTAAWPRGALLALLALVVVVAAAPRGAAMTRDDAEALAALRSGDVYVSSSELGDVAPSVAARLEQKVRELDERGLPVKLVLVAPLRGDDPFAYARSLRERLGYDGTLVVTTPRGGVGAAGTRSERSVRGAFLAARLNTIPSPVERLITASDLAVPPPPREGNSWRGLLVLIGLSLLGGAWAIGWGLRREQRRARHGAAEERAKLKVGLDALEARATDLATRAELPPEARPHLDAALAHHAAGLEEVERGTAGDPDRGVAALRAGLDELGRAAAIAGCPFPPDAPFAGLCAADPAHGPATDLAELGDRPGGPAPVCDACARRAAGGAAPRRRLVPCGGRPVPFDEAGPPGEDSDGAADHPQGVRG